MRAELGTPAPDVLDGATAALDKSRADGFVHHIDESEFEKIPSISIDYAVMERTTNAAVVGPVSCAWNDVGIWQSVGELQTSSGPVEPVLIDTRDCMVHAEDGTLVTALGVEGLVIAVHNGAILVMPKSRAQDVKLIIEVLKERGLTNRF
jgi:mannose-1-phosphate guanylyltransferase